MLLGHDRDEDSRPSGQQSLSEGIELSVSPLDSEVDGSVEFDDVGNIF